MHGTVTVTKDVIPDLVRHIHELANKQVVVGFPGSTAGRCDDIDNPSLAYIHEYGAPGANIPARPFLVRGVEEVANDLVAHFEAGARSAIDGNDVAARLFANVGNIGSQSVKAYMASGKFAPLKPTTIRRKGSSKPLIDTGRLRQAVTYEVRDVNGSNAAASAAVAGLLSGIRNIVKSSYGNR